MPQTLLPKFACPSPKIWDTIETLHLASIEEKVALKADAMPHTGCIMLKYWCPRPDTAKRILERRGIQTSSASEFDWYVFLNLKPISGLYNFLFFWHLYGLVFYLCMIYWSSFYPISYPFGIYIAWFFLSRLYWSSNAIIWEKVFSILAVNLNPSHSYLITAVLGHFLSFLCSSILGMQQCL